jgi:hypothetical protein
MRIDISANLRMSDVKKTKRKEEPEEGRREDHFQPRVVSHPSSSDTTTQDKHTSRPVVGL